MVLLSGSVPHVIGGDGDLAERMDVGSGTKRWQSTRTIASVDAHQAAAADTAFVFAISSRRIAKHDRETGECVAVSDGEAEHLNSGFVWDGRVYCAHSNYPKTPERSQIMSLDTSSMRLSVFKDFGDRGGSLTWVLRHDDHWWCNFAYYGDENHRTRLIQFDGDWNELGSWTYPKVLISQLGSYSLSGGVWRGDELWVTGHDDPVIFRLQLPASSPRSEQTPRSEEPQELEYIGRLDVPFTGQGIAVDPVTDGLVGIQRGKRLVVFATETGPVATAPRPVENSVRLRLSVMSFNIHHGEGVDGKSDLQRIANVISASKPDLVALQEVDQNVLRSGNVDQPAELARMTGMHVAFGANIALQGGEYGNAILSRYPIVSQSNTRLPNRKEGEQRGVLAAVIELPDGIPRLTFLSTHFDHRADAQERIASAVSINQQFGLIMNRWRLMAGDLNDGPQSQTIRELAKHWRVTNEQALPTIPVASPSRQIDFVLVANSEPWNVIETHVIDERVASDHRPIVSIVELGSESN